MPSAEQLRNRLLKKLAELFQLNQPDLDFGFYRIMHVKAQEVQGFINTDLLNIVAESFSYADESHRVVLQAEYEKAVQTAKDYGAPNPEDTEPVKKAKAALDAAKDTAGAEIDVYDHLYRFFERYYDDGDFISRRYYMRETPGRAAPFALPYNGEEVKLHWANADQYYIKSTEYFSNFSFDLRQAQEVRVIEQQNQRGRLLNTEEAPLRVHFRIAEASEGEHGNIKASENGKRFFILHGEAPIAFTEDGELAIYFEYRPDPEKSGQENTWREKRNAETVKTVLEHLQAISFAGGDEGKQATKYLRLLTIPAPTESDKKRPLLAKYIHRYTARNTMDYFIHKDLGGFLRRELDFYIKNEVMHLDDIENADAPAVESYLSKIRVLRRIAGKLIDFLAQLEDFQKKLWLKKKFVLETNYCITLDRVPEELYAEIVSNEKQYKEWIRLFAIDEIEAELHSPGFSRPLTVAFLKANDKLVLDTRFFSEDFKAKLLDSIENFDEQCDGLLIHSENFQALRLLQERYREQVKCIYIDPPYNTDASKIIYKNGYEHSSWLSLMESRLSECRNLLANNGVINVAIDDYEMKLLSICMDNIYGSENFISNIAILTNPKGREQGFIAQSHDYTIMYAKYKQYAETNNFILSDDELLKKFSKQKNGKSLRELPLKRTGTGKLREERPYMYFPFFYNPETYDFIVIPNEYYNKIYKKETNSFDDKYLETIINKFEQKGYKAILPLGNKGELLRWRWGYNSCVLGVKSGILFCKHVRGGGYSVYQYDFADSAATPKSFWLGERYDASSKGTNLLESIMQNNQFDFPKSLYTVIDNIKISSSTADIVLDYFAGSGTTGHAVIETIREGEGRKYILVEMGEHFNTVLKPRIEKVVYSENWKDGKPVVRNTGISHCFKYLRLESYEDTLNNLRFDRNPQRQNLLGGNPSLKEDYMLRYMLDVETRGSQSLLNIDAFADPTSYTLNAKKPGTDEYATCTVDLLETFNYLIGLRISHLSTPQTFAATFKRVPDPELPEDQHTRLMVDGHMREDKDGPWWFRTVEGWVPGDPANPDNGQRENVLIVWRKLTGDMEQDNLMLDEWFKNNYISPRDFAFDTIYVNGSNNLPNLKGDDENWIVRLIEEEFMQRMWSGDNT